MFSVLVAIENLQAYAIRIVGRVQGVGFRWFTERAATRFGIRGYVRNSRDGSVEIFAQAASEALEAFRAELREGPRAARVDDIQVKQVPVDPDLVGFDVRF